MYTEVQQHTPDTFESLKHIERFLMQKEALTPHTKKDNNVSETNTFEIRSEPFLECKTLLDINFPLFEHIPTSPLLDDNSDPNQDTSDEEYLLAVVDACRAFEEIYQEWLDVQNTKDTSIKLKTLLRQLNF